MAKSFYILFSLLFVGFLIYIPIWNTGFFSDDFAVLNRIQYGDFHQGSFFRPLSDFSIYLDYFIWGKKAVGFHITSVLLHVCTAWLIYFLVLTLAKYLNTSFQNSFAIAALCAFLFLLYPFHNEPVVWIVGRGILLASLFAVMAYLLYMKAEGSAFRLPATGLFYFLALLSYEAVIVLPLVLLVTEVIRRKEKSVTKIVLRLIPLIIVFALYLFIRWYNIGSLVGSSVYFRVSTSAFKMMMNFFRLTERTIIPPLENYKTAIAFAIIGFIAIGVLFYIKRKNLSPLKPLLVLLGASYLIALLPVLTIGINTHTSEGERFLYFPSVFFASFVGVAGFALFRNIYSKIIFYLLTVIYFTFFLVLENKNWNRSDKIIKGIICAHEQYLGQGNLYIIDMPDNFDGAFIFRNGFYQAFQFYQIPFVNNDRLKILSWMDVHRNKETFQDLRKKDGVLRIGSRFTIRRYPAKDSWILSDNSANVTYPVSDRDKIFYFDGKLLKQLFL